MTKPEEHRPTKEEVTAAYRDQLAAYGRVIASLAESNDDPIIEEARNRGYRLLAAEVLSLALTAIGLESDPALMEEFRRDVNTALAACLEATPSGNQSGVYRRNPRSGEEEIVVSTTYPKEMGERAKIITVNEGLTLIDFFGLLDGVAPKTLRRVAASRGVRGHVTRLHKMNGLEKLGTNLKGFAARQSPPKS